MKKLLLVIFLLSFQAAIAASVLIEPYGGYIVRGDSWQEKSNGTKTEWTYTGFGYGWKVGFSHFGFMGGLEHAKSTYTLINVESETEDDYEGSYLGLFVGYNFPLLLRLWATFFLDAEFEAVGTATTYVEDGSGFSVGLGYLGFGYVSVNIEYRSFTMTEATLGDTTYEYPRVVNGVTRGEFMYRDIMMSLSVPLSIF